MTSVSCSSSKIISDLKLNHLKSILNKFHFSLATLSQIPSLVFFLLHDL